MNAGGAGRKQSPFQFVLDELDPIRPAVRQMFGFTYVYLDEKLLLSIRKSVKQPRFNGVWLYTQAEHIESLRKEFPLLPKRSFWRAGNNAWVILASTLDDFEEYAFKACELILKGDQRIGRATRRVGSADKNRRERYQRVP